MVKGKRLVILGAGGHGKVAADVARRMCYYEKILFLDDNEAITECDGFPVVGKCQNMQNYIEGYDIFAAVGSGENRARIMAKLFAVGANIPVLVHPDAVVGQGVLVESGTVIMAGAVVNADAQIGEGCIINTCSSVDHDCRLGNYVHVSVGAHVAGGVQIGANCLIGAGAVVSNYLKIVSDCTIGAGAVVVKDIGESGTYVGVPARKRSSE